MEGQLQAKSQPKPTKGGALANSFEEPLKNDHKVDLDAFDKACSLLPANYSFEMHKTACRILEAKRSLK